jgi:hypothetical protein
MRIQAAQQILDRVGLGKTDRLDVTVNTQGGLFILPAKEETVLEADYMEYDEDDDEYYYEEEDE